MRPEHQIEIDRLLLAREECFVRIHEIEHEITALLGEPWPLVRPPLPSDARGRRKAPRPAAARDPLRRLEGLETAYRVTYRRGDQTCQEDHDDSAALRSLFATQGEHLQVLRLETIDLGGRARSVLFAAPPAAVTPQSVRPAGE